MKLLASVQNQDTPYALLGYAHYIENEACKWDASFKSWFTFATYTSGRFVDRFVWLMNGLKDSEPI